jgi:hypothetical protein
MGVKGLWQLLEPVGRPVTLESLEGKVLSVGILCLKRNILSYIGSKQSYSRGIPIFSGTPFMEDTIQ